MKNQLETMISKYLESRKVKGLSPETLRLDKTALNKFAAYLTAAKLKFNRTTLIDLQNYQAFLQSQNIAPAGICKYLTVLRCFCRYCRTENLILHNPAARLGLPKQIDRTPRNIPDVAQIQKLLAAPDLNALSGLRDRAILELAYSAGLRRNEIISLNRVDLDLNARQLRVTGKGGKERAVPFGKSAAHYLKLYLKASSEINPAEPALFQNKYGNRLGALSVQNCFAAYNLRLGFRFTFHSLRHACALHMLQNHAGIRHIQELLGHT
jgi:site-specific recombinase XerD